MKNILIINGSVRGTQGNSWKLSKAAEQKLESYGTKPSIINLSGKMEGVDEVYKLLVASDAFLVVTGTYWNNWGSPLQRFIEVVTAFENSPAFFGKPVACAVTIDSVGGIEVAARLHGVFSGLGCWSPPCSTIVLSRVGQEAIAASTGKADNPNDDVWRLDDLDVVLKNLVSAASIKNDWLSWPHVVLKTPDKQWPGNGDLDMGTPVFLP
jgi:chromate reductase